MAHVNVQKVAANSFVSRYTLSRCCWGMQPTHDTLHRCEDGIAHCTSEPQFCSQQSLYDQSLVYVSHTCGPASASIHGRPPLLDTIVWKGPSGFSKLSHSNRLLTQQGSQTPVNCQCVCQLSVCLAIITECVNVQCVNVQCVNAQCVYQLSVCVCVCVCVCVYCQCVFQLSGCLSSVSVSDKCVCMQLAA